MKLKQGNNWEQRSHWEQSVIIYLNNSKEPGIKNISFSKDIDKKELKVKVSFANEDIQNQFHEYLLIKEVEKLSHPKLSVSTFRFKTDDFEIIEKITDLVMLIDAIDPLGESIKSEIRDGASKCVTPICNWKIKEDKAGSVKYESTDKSLINMLGLHRNNKELSYKFSDRTWKHNIDEIELLLHAVNPEEFKSKGIRYFKYAENHFISKFRFKKDDSNIGKTFHKHMLEINEITHLGVKVITDISKRFVEEGFIASDEKLISDYISILLEEQVPLKDFEAFRKQIKYAKEVYGNIFLLELCKILEDSDQPEKAAEVFQVINNDNPYILHKTWESANNSFALGKYEEALEHALKICFMPEAKVLIGAIINAALSGYMNNLYEIDSSSITTIIDTLNKNAASFKLAKINVLIKLIQENTASEVLLNAFATLFTKEQISKCEDYVKQHGGNDPDIAAKVMNLAHNHINGASIKFQQAPQFVMELIKDINLIKGADYNIAEALIKHHIPNEILYDIINQLTLTQEQASKLLGEKGILFVSNEENGAVVNSEVVFGTLSEKAGITVYPDGTIISLDGSIHTLEVEVIAEIPAEQH